MALCGDFCRASCAQKSRFSAEIAKASVEFGADFAREMRRAAPKNVQKTHVCAAQHVYDLHCFCAHFLRVVRTFRTEITLRICGQKFTRFCVNFLKISAMTAADACKTHKNDAHHHIMPSAHDVHRLWRSVVIFVAHLARQNLDFRLKSPKFSSNSALILRATCAERLPKMCRRSMCVPHSMCMICIASARTSCVLCARFAPKSQNFAVENSRDFARIF